jgi:hypothetical protein
MLPDWAVFNPTSNKGVACMDRGSGLWDKGYKQGMQEHKATTPVWEELFITPMKMKWYKEA